MNGRAGVQANATAFSGGPNCLLEGQNNGIDYPLLALIGCGKYATVGRSCRTESQRNSCGSRDLTGMRAPRETSKGYIKS